MLKKLHLITLAVLLPLACSDISAWDHPGHMATAAIAFADLKKARPDLIDKIGLLMLKHPDPSSYWVAAGEARGKELTRRMFIQASRWPDDARWTINDRPAWHSARWAIVTDDAPPETRKLADARGGMPSGQALEALALNAAVLSDPESKPDERALALSWLLHILGDIHQPFHASDLYSKHFPAGNPAGAMGFVEDPLEGAGMQLHLLWDMNTRRSVELDEVDGYAQAIMEQVPRSALPELTDFQGPQDFEKWARESHQVAIDWAFDIEMIADPEPDQQKVVQKMINFILTGESPVEGAPAVPDEYWDKLQDVSERRLALAGYRIADIIIAAADRIETERSLAREAMDAMPKY